MLGTAGDVVPMRRNGTSRQDIGEVLARRIIDYRESAGDFRTVEELINVEGIGEKWMEQILDLVTIGG